MEKAYDLKDLGLRFKAHGLEALENNAEIAAKVVFEWLDESAKISPMPYDDMAAAAVYPKLKELVAAQVNKIDGKEG